MPAQEQDIGPVENMSKARRTLGTTLVAIGYFFCRCRRTFVILFLLGLKSVPSDLEVVYLSWTSSFPFRWITQDPLAYVDMLVQNFHCLPDCGSGFPFFGIKTATDLHVPGH